LIKSESKDLNKIIIFQINHVLVNFPVIN